MTKNLKMKKLLILIILPAVILSACEKENPVIPNEEELITTVTYELTPANGGDKIIFKFTDLDGDGGNDPVFETSPLSANTVYNGVLKLENELETPPENITEEVEAEGAEHQFFFIDNFLKFDVAYGDEDINGNPVGIETILETGASTTGTLTIILRHEPKKPNNGTPEDAGGETDVEVTFDVTVQ